MDYKKIIASLRRKEASDLHLEPGLQPSARINGVLKPLSNDVLDSQATQSIAKELLSNAEWTRFCQRMSCDLSVVISGVRCRVHVMKTKRGVGLAIRLFSSHQPTLEKLNLHPDLKKLVDKKHGLIVVCGPTGSGKSSTLAGLLHEVSVRKSLHIVTIEHPVEYPILPRKSFVRQREVGVDTPSFEQALVDAMREDPDLIMVGEMRTPETIQLTLNAAETGQLVLTTLHASNTAEAVQRIVSSFSPEIQSSVCCQLADSLVAIVAQSLQFNENYQIRIPVCEVLMATHPVRNLIRQGQFFKINSALETGHAEGSWTRRRYQRWLEERTDFYIPDSQGQEAPDFDFQTEEITPELELPPFIPKPSSAEAPKERQEKSSSEDVIVIDEPEDESLSEIIKKMDDAD